MLTFPHDSSNVDCIQKYYCIVLSCIVLHLHCIGLIPVESIILKLRTMFFKRKVLSWDLKEDKVDANLLHTLMVLRTKNFGHHLFLWSNEGHSRYSRDRYSADPAINLLITVTICGDGSITPTIS